MLAPFQACKKFASKTSVPFPSQYATQTIAKLQEEFRTRFADFEHVSTADR